MGHKGQGCGHRGQGWGTAPSGPEPGAPPREQPGAAGSCVRGECTGDFGQERDKRDSD